MLDQADPRTLLALLDWQVELGADEAILDAPVDRYALAEAEERRPAAAPPLARPAAPPPPAAAPEVDAVAAATEAAERADSLEALAAAMAAFPHCELRKGARNFVFADGRPEARVMVVGEAPGREEDLEGRPFVGRAGQMLDRMFGAIGLGRDRPDPGAALYITNVLPWRPPGNRAPDPAEIAMLLPFLTRHVQLAQPDVLVLMGNTPCQALLGRAGILRLRGQWTEALGRPALPMTHPSYLLRTPEAKREAWADLLSLKARLAG
ncbi:uracil-DNA glycosylase [Wenxinia marina]|uniref:Type-4 uracil-DNA glycosylase n=1 Tax=Wenxinia marina DSM 24838 TaxID=1123501 RepID=A0A0D0Q8Z8_9RHOB|nr:uracil-DNA glycosylase [Wenxinia marina]KIQ70889.1 uracil-DNA glycosylase, family 4 [Wenxinia marina DSM 24838]GGL56503.1 uracil-DNA glycosylase [Wenxinia marina]